MYRRLKAIFFIILYVGPLQDTMAMVWKDLWQTRDQQAQKEFNQGHVAKAAQLFQDPFWKGSAAYKSKDYQKAAEYFAQLNTAEANYNRGNALAHLGQFEQAIGAYEKALKQQPDLKDAQYNLELVKKLLKSSSSQQSQQENKKQNNNSKEQNQNPSSQQNSSSQNKQKQQSQQQIGSNSNQVSPEGKPSQTQQQKDLQAKFNPSQQEQKSTLQDQLSKQKLEKQLQESHMQKNKSTQEQLKVKQWVQQIPDDPGGLLRNKFLRDHLQQNFPAEEGEES